MPLSSIFLFLASFIGMEVLSWCIHKYLFHGPLWFIHKTHHMPRQGRLEWNDLFSIGFAGLSIGLMLRGLPALSYSFWIGAGIATYGILYFVLHDVFIHQRAGWYRQSKWTYLQRLRRAHKLHHKSLQKSPSSFFGLLWVNKKSLNTERQQEA